MLILLVSFVLEHRLDIADGHRISEAAGGPEAAGDALPIQP